MVKKKRHMLGICVYCEKPIYEDQKYEMLAYDVPAPWENKYKTGPVHMRCRLPLLKMFVKNLMGDIRTLTWFIKNSLKTDVPEQEEKRKGKKWNRKTR